MTRVSLVALALCCAAGTARAYTPLVHDPSVGINTVRHGGSEGWVAHWDLAAYPDGAIEYYINPRFPEGVQPFASTEALVDAVQRAFRTWEEVPGCAVRFHYAGLADETDAFDGRNVVTFAPSYKMPEGFPGGVFPRAWYSEREGPVAELGGLFTAFRPGQTVDCDITWFPGAATALEEAGSTPDSLSFRGILIHEIGHMLGLDHSGLGQTTMYAYSTMGRAFTNERLSEDDTTGISTLYPEPGFLASHGKIAGTVLDHDGKPLAGAHVVAVDADTGAAHCSTVSGLAGLRPDGMPDRYSLGSGDFLLVVPPGRYILLVEPFGAPAQGMPYLSGIFGAASGKASFVRTDFGPEITGTPIEVPAGGGIGGINVAVGPLRDGSPVLGRTACRRWEAGTNAWSSPARIRQGEDATMAFSAGVNIVGPGALADGFNARFLGPGLSVSGTQTDPNGERLCLVVSAAADTPVGPRVLEVRTAAGLTYFPGAVGVLSGNN